MTDMLLTLEEEYEAKRKWNRLPESTRPSWRDYWLQAQISKAQTHYIVLMEKEYNRGVSDDKAKRLDRPSILFHKVTHKPEQDIVDSIAIKGILPRIASEYKDLIPEIIRDKPIIWLASKLHSYTDAPVFLVDTSILDINKLYHVEDVSLAWWVYEGSIPPDQVLALKGDRE